MLLAGVVRADEGTESWAASGRTEWRRRRKRVDMDGDASEASRDCDEGGLRSEDGVEDGAIAETRDARVRRFGNDGVSGGSSSSWASRI